MNAKSMDEPSGSHYGRLALTTPDASREAKDRAKRTERMHSFPGSTPTDDRLQR